jgi:F-type H+-transporting ATPase subunit epsilon
MAALRCTVVSPERPLFEGSADKVVAPGVKGQIAVLPRHAPLIAKLDAGIMRIHRGAEDGAAVEQYAISGGFLQVKDDVVTLLVTDATRAEDLDAGKLEAELETVLEALRHPRSDEEYVSLLHRRRSLQAQMQIVGAK